MSAERCPCDSGRPYAACCGPLHGGEPAASAEALMRARYSAFVLERADYLLRSWHPSTRPATVEFAAGTRWLGLRVEQQRQTGEARAEVEFLARFRVGGGSAVRQRERSRFLYEDGHWYYLDGDPLA